MSARFQGCGVTGGARPADPAVSLVIPVADDAAGTSATLRSAAYQSLCDLEVLVVHTGDAATAELVGGHRRHDLRLRDLALPGATAAELRNSGLAAASGTYVMFLEPGDELRPRACELLAEAATRYGADVATGQVTRIDPASGATVPPGPDDPGPPAEPEVMLAGVAERPELLAGRTTTGLLWRREPVHRTGLRFTEAPRQAGALFAVAALLRAEGIVVLEAPVCESPTPVGGRPPRDGTPAEEVAAFATLVETERRIDDLLGRLGAGELKAHKDGDFLRTGLAAFIARLPGWPEAQRRAFVELAGPYVATLDPGAVESAGAVERVQAHFLCAGDVAGVTSTAGFAQSGNPLAGCMAERDGRVYWGEAADAAGPLDVTELGVHRTAFGDLKLFNRIESIAVRDGRLTITGAVVNPLGWIREGEPLDLHLLLHDRVAGRIHRRRVRGVRVSRCHVAYTAAIDLRRAIPAIPRGAQEWPLALEIRWHGKTNVSEFWAGDLDLGAVTFEPPRTPPARPAPRPLPRAVAAVARPTGELALRPVPGPHPLHGAWEWFRGRPSASAPAAAAPPRCAVVVAAYNVAEYLPETLASIAAQSMFGHTELICVDDGSTDGTGAILDAFAAEHPGVTVLHQANAGAGAARNAALAHVTAPYVTFTDADDILAEDALAALHEAAVATGADVVMGDLVTFPTPRPYGPWKRHFGHGDTTVAGLDELPDLIFSASAANKLFRTEHARAAGAAFGEGVHFDDAWYTLPAMIHAGSIALVDRPVYYYRGRADGTSLMDALWRRPRNVADHLHLNNHLLRLAAGRPKLNRVIARYATRTYQNFLTTATDLLPATEIETLFPHIHAHYREIEDATILEYVRHPYALAKHHAAKTGDLALYLDPSPAALESATDPERRLAVDGHGLYRPATAGGALLRVTSPQAQLESLRAEGERILVEGRLTLPGIDLTEPLDNPLELVVKYPGGTVAVPVRQVYRRDLWHARAGRDLRAGWAAEIDAAALAALGTAQGTLALRVHHGERHADIAVTARTAGQRDKGITRAGRHRVGVWTGAGDAVQLTYRGRRPAEALAAARRWLRREAGRVIRRRPGWPLRLLYWLTRPVLAPRDIWIIGERSDTAQDNGYHLFKWIRENHPRRRAYYVIDADAPDRAKVEPLGNVLTRGSLAHRLHLLHATKLIGSYDLESYLLPGGEPKLRYLRTFGDLIRYKRVFLQHGVIYNDVSRALARQLTSYDLFVTSAPAEREFIASELAYGGRAVELGLPRFDALRRVPAERPTVLIMPTWRKDIVVPSYNKRFKPTTPFVASDYFRFFAGLLGDERLLDALRDAGVRVEFHPHYEIQPHLHHFDLDPELVAITGNGTRDVQDALRECSLLVTDFSSVFFDAAYMGTPVVHVPFDEQAFYRDHYRRGYFDLDRDGFGPVCRTVDETVEAIVHAIKREFTVESPYRERAAAFFTHRDAGNRERVHRAIEAL
ncbi:MAG: glycosyltransferase [Streptosporangiales bacterium]|nr:glycosyltransferase [Streptosporangiales bacterium]